MAVADVVKREARLLRSVSYLASGSEPTGAAAAAYISLGSDLVYAIPTAKKNGATIAAGTGYLWTTGRPNVLIPASALPAANDHYEFVIQTQLDDTAITDYVDEAERQIVSKLVSFYPASLDLTANATVQTLIAMWASGRIKEDLSSGVALESAHYRSGRELKQSAMDAVRSIQNGEMDLVDSSDDVVARTAGSIIGAVYHADGAITERRDIRNRITDFQQSYLPFFSFNSTDITESE